MPETSTNPDKADGNPFVAYQMLILVVSLLSLGIMASSAGLSLSPETRSVLDVADLVVCGLFLLDFGVSLSCAPNKLRYLATWGWLDLLSSIPAIDLARWGRAARVLRILRVLRVMRATKIMAELAMRHRAQNAAMAGVLLLLLVVFASSIAILHFEDIEGGNIREAHDAMWWAVTTVSTVGYGDFYPVTWEGRLIAVLLMVTGVGSFAAIAAGLVSWFMPPAEGSEVARLVDEIGRLRQAIESKQAVPPDAVDTSPHTIQGGSKTLLSAIVALSALTAAAEPPKVISVHDGDTLRVVQDGQQTTIRLQGIDAPEIGQPFGTKSRDRLIELAKGKHVVIHADKPDRFGRLVACVEVNGLDVGSLMVADGLAWHFARFSNDPALAAAEQRARRGCGAMPSPCLAGSRRRLKRYWRCRHRDADTPAH